MAWNEWLRQKATLAAANFDPTPIDVDQAAIDTPQRKRPIRRRHRQKITDSDRHSHRSHPNASRRATSASRGGSIPGSSSMTSWKRSSSFSCSPKRPNASGTGWSGFKNGEHMARAGLAMSGQFIETADGDFELGLLSPLSFLRSVKPLECDCKSRAQRQLHCRIAMHPETRLGR
jgi:hypothetical protein